MFGCFGADICRQTERKQIWGQLFDFIILLSHRLV